LCSAPIPNFLSILSTSLGLIKWILFSGAPVQGRKVINKTIIISKLKALGFIPYVLTLLTQLANICNNA